MSWTSPTIWILWEIWELSSKGMVSSLRVISLNWMVSLVPPGLTVDAMFTVGKRSMNKPARQDESSSPKPILSKADACWAFPVNISSPLSAGFTPAQLCWGGGGGSHSQSNYHISFLMAQNCFFQTSKTLSWSRGSSLCTPFYLMTFSLALTIISVGLVWLTEKIAHCETHTLKKKKSQLSIFYVPKLSRPVPWLGRRGATEGGIHHHVREVPDPTVIPWQGSLYYYLHHWERRLTPDGKIVWTSTSDIDWMSLKMFFF